MLSWGIQVPASDRDFPPFTEANGTVILYWPAAIRPRHLVVACPAVANRHR
jgi:hypothetical protein